MTSANRQRFNDQLQTVKQDLTRMGVLVEESLAKSIQSLKDMNVKLAEEVIERDSLVNKLEQEIDTKCATLIATQQPVASDLRKLIAAIRIATDLERMADLSVDIAKVTKRISGQGLIKPLIDLPKMAQITQQMIRDGLRSYIDEDIQMAKKLGEDDHQVDSLYKQVVTEMFNLIQQDVSMAQQGMHLCFVGRYIERIADHATNIGESAIYIATGKREDLNQ
jgi:phosphate transport system protein